MPPQPVQGVYLYVQVRISGQVQSMLVPRMLQKIPIDDRTFMLRKYPRCFTGADAVYFFITNRFARTEHEAISIGNALLKAGVFRHVKNEHLFRNGNYFYRFAAHEDYAIDDDTLNLRSSRMMSVACNSFMRMPEIRRIDTANLLSDSNYSDDTFFTNDSATTDDRPEFDEADIVVETGIRIGTRIFPNLVSNITQAKDLVGTNSVRGKILEKSFTGRDAAKWLVRHRYAKTPEEAVCIGNAMLSSGVFYPLENDNGGFEATMKYFRMMADTDISRELKRGARKDAILKFLGINRTRPDSVLHTHQSPWFEDQISFSFTSDRSASR